jgi:cupin fold WbuC family metalloprotein
MSLHPFSAEDLAALRLAAQQSPRRRAHRELHADGSSALVQQFLVGVVQGSYFRAHCHRQAHKTELTVALHGCCEVLQFNDAGVLLDRQRLGEGGVGCVQIPPQTWHAIAAIDDFAVFLEVKQGPYEAATDKCFADWAPLEGTPAAEACERWLREGAIGSRFE